MSTVIVGQQKGPGCLIQILWFVFIGWWAGQIWISLAWLLMLSILGIPLGVMMLNYIPKVIALRETSSAVTVYRAGGVTVVDVSGQAPQRNILIRALYFLLIGWWLSAIWMEIAYFFCLTILALPLGFWMFDRVPALVSLRR